MSITDAWRPALDAQGFAASPGRDAGGGPLPAQAHAWQRAFERAQQGEFSGWFSAVPQGTANSDTARPAARVSASMVTPRAALTPGGNTGPARSDEAAGCTDASQHRPQPAQPEARRQGASGAPGKPCVPVEALAAALADVLWAPLDMSSGASTSAAGIGAVARAWTASTSTLAGAATENVPVRSVPVDAAETAVEAEALRLHAEWSAGDLRLWLGANGRLPMPLEAIVATLRRLLDGRGARLLEVVCNGRVVWPAQAEVRDYR